MAKSTAGIGPKGMKKMMQVMHEWKTGQLRSGAAKGPIVRNQKQAIAVGLSEARKASRAGKRKR